MTEVAQVLAVFVALFVVSCVAAAPCFPTNYHTLIKAVETGKPVYTLQKHFFYKLSPNSSDPQSLAPRITKSDLNN
jgi:hypothetical protein